MKKIETLRAALAEAIPELRREPDRLRIWIEDGAASSRQSETLGFGFAYRASLLIVETKTDLALIALPIFRWLRINQPDLLAPGAEGFSFDADILDNESWDVLIQLQLRENVTVVPREDGGWSLDYLAEPDPLFSDDSGLDDAGDIPGLTEVITTARPSE